MLTVIAATVLLQPAQAQSPTNPGREYCDELLPKVQKELQDDANAQCQTLYVCLECVERKSNQVLYATIVVQPTSPNCRSLKEISTLDTPPSRGNEKPKRPRFQVEIIQSPCFAEGNNLEVFIPGWGQGTREFSYLWEIDGNKGGHLPSVTCACGKEARVRVTHLPSGESVVKIIKLSPCNDSDK